MRHNRLVPVAVLAVALLPSACASPSSPSPSLAGSWVESFSIPGASLGLTLDASGSGRGAYAIEAGRSGAVNVTASIDRTMITLVIRYDYGLVQTFIGTLADANHLMGSFENNPTTVTFTRR
jgi:hypothetical protein